MRSFQEKKRWRNLAQSWPALALLCVLALFFAWSVFGFWGKMEGTKKNRQLAEEKVAELEDKKARLSADIEKLSTEEGIEENIREKFGLAREGEGVIIIADDEKEAKEEAKSGGFFNWLKNLFR